MFCHTLSLCFVTPFLYVLSHPFFMFCHTLSLCFVTPFLYVLIFTKQTTQIRIRR
ncbi:hypothetical protein T492DRAFT_1012480 [Pavlovales sp. CCMP2436]|nr:hypothetical protein T492DRAFT_1012480 [Pavlovales sp. CCMP2436]